MNRDELDKAISDYLANGGEVVRLKEASKKDVAKAQRIGYHRDKALAGSERSKKFLEEEAKKEAAMIFSKVDRMRADK